MNKKYLLLYLILFFIFIISTNMSAQNCEVQNNYTDRVYSNEEICKLENRICCLLNETNIMSEDNKVVIYYIPGYELKGRLGEIITKYKKSDFINGSILNRLKRTSPIDLKGEKYVDVDVVITNLSDSLLAFGNAERLFVAAKYSRDYYSFYTFLIESRRKFNIKYFFSIKSPFLSTVFGVTESNDIFVFLRGNKVYSIAEFVTLYSEDPFYKDYFYD